MWVRAGGCMRMCVGACGWVRVHVGGCVWLGACVCSWERYPVLRPPPNGVLPKEGAAPPPKEAPPKGAWVVLPRPELTPNAGLPPAPSACVHMHVHVRECMCVREHIYVCGMCMCM